MGVRYVDHHAATPTLALPLKGGGDNHCYRAVYHCRMGQTSMVPQSSRGLARIGYR